MEVLYSNVHFLTCDLTSSSIWTKSSCLMRPKYLSV